MKCTSIKYGTNGIRRSHRDREERNGIQTGYKAFALRGAEMVELLDLRIAVTASGTPYACLWVKQLDGAREWSNGSGTASGYGVHKPSAAVNEAIRAAGIKIDHGINGVGDGAIREAVKAIADYIAKDLPVYVVEMNA